MFIYCCTNNTWSHLNLAFSEFSINISQDADKQSALIQMIEVKREQIYEKASFKYDVLVFNSFETLTNFDRGY